MPDRTATAATPDAAQDPGAGRHHTRRGDGINLTRPEIVAGIAAYGAEDQDALIWLHGYTCDELGGSRSRLMEQLRGMDWTTLARVWSGKYGADIAKVMERIRKFRAKAESTLRKRFVETIVTQKIWSLCDVARDRSAMVLISGPTGRSKTWTIDEWRHCNNHGRAVKVTARKSGGLRVFLEDLGTALNISASRSQYAIMHAVEHALDERNVLIVDEVARLYPTGRAGSLDALEFIRDLHDRCGCGVILCATDGLEGLLRSGKYAMWFDQLLGRIELHLRIPRAFGRQEVAELLAAYVDDPDPALVNAARDIANRSTRGCRDLFRHLDRAAQVAAEVGKPLTAEILTATVAAAAKLLTLDQE